MNEHLTTGSIFDDLNLDPGEAEQMKIKAVLFDSIIRFITENKLSQEQTAEIMGVESSLVENICKGKISGFTIDALVAMTARAGLHPLLIAA